MFTTHQQRSFRPFRPGSGDLGSRLIFALVVTLSGFFALAAFAIGAIHARDKINTQVVDYISYLNQIGDFIAFDLATYDMAALERDVTFFVTEPAITGIKISGRYGDEIISHNMQEANVAVGSRAVNIPISYRGEAVGSLEVMVNMGNIVDASNSPILLASVAFVLCATVGALVIFVYINRFVSAPLRELEDACELTLRTGEHHTAKFVSSDRFGSYARAFNAMQARLGDLSGQKQLLLGDLEQEQSAFEAFLNSSRNAIFIFDAEGACLMRRGMLITELLEDQQLAPRSLADYEALLGRCGKLIADGANNRRYLVEIRKGNSDEGLKSLSFSFHDAGQGRIALYAFDISDLRKAEVAVRQLQKSRALGELTFGISHDFNNILGGISASVLALCEDKTLKLNADQRGLIQHCLTATEMGANLCRQLLAYSRQTELKQEPIDLARVLREMGQFLQRTIGGNYQIHVETDESPVAVLDSSMLQRSLTNLAINARNAMPGGGDIHLQLRTDRAAGTATITVFNPGSHIPDELLDRVFDPFFTTRADRGGSGLGLSVVQGFVQQSGGTVRIENRCNGVAVSMRFSLAPETASAPPPRSLTSRPVPETTHPLRILVVDDNALLLKGITMLLQTQGHSVDSTISAIDLRERFGDLRAHDLLISDVLMPDVNGVALGKLLRQGGNHIPIIFMTGLETSSVREQICDIDNAWVISKPVKLDKLRSLVGQIGLAQV